MAVPQFLAIVLFLFHPMKCALPNDDYIIDRASFEARSENSPKVEEEKNWPRFSHLGQVTGIAVDGEGNLHVFHRGDRIWDQQTFDEDHRLADMSKGPIQNDTVLVLDPNSGEVLFSWGANMFYMPHGLTVDRHGNSWITDVGLHQVMKFSARGLNPELIIGEAFVPGFDDTHFCQPSDVVVTPTGNFFVSDGYCNSRILMFDSSGRLIEQMGAKDGMKVPHSLTLVPEHDAVCVADRENGRMLCYATGTDGTAPGMPLTHIDGKSLAKIYAIDTRGKQLFAVNGPNSLDGAQSEFANRGIVIDMESGTPKTIWTPDEGFYWPHDLAVSPDGKYVYVSEIDITSPRRVYKFNIYD